jgi:hypothetical protein
MLLESNAYRNTAPVGNCRIWSGFLSAWRFVRSDAAQPLAHDSLMNRLLVAGRLGGSDRQAGPDQAKAARR